MEQTTESCDQLSTTASSDQVTLIDRTIHQSKSTVATNKGAPSLESAKSFDQEEASIFSAASLCDNIGIFG